MISKQGMLTTHLKTMCLLYCFYTVYTEVSREIMWIGNSSLSNNLYNRSISLISLIKWYVHNVNQFVQSPTHVLQSPYFRNITGFWSHSLFWLYISFTWSKAKWWKDDVHRLDGWILILRHTYCKYSDVGCVCTCVCVYVYTHTVSFLHDIQ